MPKSILIISFTFPPSSGIGGRRWVKFAKYLKRNEHKVKIIAAKNNLNKTSEWISDLAEIKDDIMYVNSNYPKWLTINPKSFYQKILYRLSLLYCKLFIKGNYYDRSSFIEKNLLSTARKLITENSIQNVICTVGPFKMSSFIIKFKEEFPHINFILDYRDPWTNNKTSFGYDSISSKRFQTEVATEKLVVKSYDKILMVSKEMSNYFIELVPDISRNKFVELKNGFDPEDLAFSTFILPNEIKSDKILVVFTGTFYNRSTHVLIKLIEIIDNMKAYKNIQFIFAGDMSIENQISIQKLDNFFYLGKKNKNEANYLVNISDYCALFLTDDLNYSFSTKFYEYLHQEKKILCFSKKTGETGEFIKDNNLGYAIDFDNMDMILLELLKIGKTNHIKSSFPNLNKFSVPYLTEKLENILL